MNAVLTELGERALPPGTILRFPAAYPYEDMVDFMITSFPDRCGLVVTTGYKAGLIAGILPAEAVPKGMIGLSASWLATNWTTWVWPDGDARLVQVIEGYPAPIG